MEAQTTEQESVEQQKPSFSLLAKEHFGNNFKGEVKEKGEPQGEPLDEQQEEPDEEVQLPQEEESGELPEESTDEDEKPTEEEGEPITSLDELVEHYEWDKEWVDSINVPVKVDGEVSRVPLKDLVAGYQMNQAADKRLEEAKARAQSLNQEISQKSEAVQAQFAVAAKLIKQAENLLDDDSSSIDWQRLREDDPAEYSAKKAEFAERRQRIEEMKSNASAEYQQSAQQIQQALIQQMQEVKAKETEALLDALPEWREESTRKAEQQKLVGYLKNTGFSEQDIGSASDHRLILLARKAMLFDEGQTKVQTAKKKVSKVPRVVKPGASRSPDEVTRQREQKARDQLKKSASMEDAYKLLKLKRQARR